MSDGRKNNRANLCLESIYKATNFIATHNLSPFSEKQLAEAIQMSIRRIKAGKK